MSISLLLHLILIEGLTGQIFDLDIPICGINPDGEGGILAESSILETESMSSLSRIPENAEVLWTTDIPADYISCIFIQDSTLLLTAYSGWTAGDSSFYIGRLSMSNGDVISQHLQSADSSGYPRALIEIDDGQLLLFTDLACYRLDYDLSMEYIFAMPAEIDRIIGASLMSDGSVEIAGTMLSEQYFLFWIDVDNDPSLIDIWDGGLVASASYASQPDFKSILSICKWPFCDSPPEYYITVRSLLAPPGENLFTMDIESNSSFCILEDGSLILIQGTGEKDSSCLLIQKFDESGVDIWSNELNLDIGEYDYLVLSGITPTSGGFAVACRLGSLLDDKYILLLLDDQGRLPGQSGEIVRNLNTVIFPNPFTDTAVLELTSEIIGSVQVEITDISGRQLRSIGPSNIDKIISYEIENLPSGVYIVEVLFQPIYGNSEIYSLKAICIE